MNFGLAVFIIEISDTPESDTSNYCRAEGLADPLGWRDGHNAPASCPSQAAAELAHAEDGVDPERPDHFENSAAHGTAGSP